MLSFYISAFLRMGRQKAVKGAGELLHHCSLCVPPLLHIFNRLLHCISSF
jgi:hypothetical protein